MTSLNPNKSTFSADMESISTLLKTGQCLRIPTYQRDLAWEEEEADRLLEDISKNIDDFIEDTKKITFIGALIFLNNRKGETSDEGAIRELPASVYNVIDGQQRLTTLLLIAVCLHDVIRRILSNATDISEFLNETSKDILKELSYVFEDDQRHGEVPFYPRMIRSDDDRWSKSRDRIKYISPISRILHAYGNHYRNSAAEYSRFLDDASISQRSENIESLSFVIKESIEKLVRKSGDMPDPERLNCSVLMKSLFDRDVLKEINPRHVKLFKVLTYARYFLRRVQFVAVISGDEGYALDIFDSLNTTGELLTSFETFRPEVIKDVGPESYKTSIPEAYMKNIDAAIQSIGGRKRDKINKTTKELVTHFALVYDGYKLPGKLGDQRRYLRDSFDRSPAHNITRDKFLEHILDVAEFMKIWHRKASEDFSDETMFCLYFLKDIGHTIAIPLLSRFYSAFLHSPPTDKKKAQVAVRRYSSFNWISGHDSFLEARFLRSYFVDMLKEGGISRKMVRDFSDWHRTSSLVGIGSGKVGQRRLARFLLLIASEKSDAHPQQPGMLTASHGNNRILTPGNWGTSNMFKTVEHIAPQKPLPRTKWDKNIYADIEKQPLHALGNLILLPKYENSRVSNGEWPLKKAFYKIFSSANDIEMKQALKEAVSSHVITEEESINIRTLCSDKLLMAKAVSRVGDFNRDIILQRTENMSKFIWNILAEDWLDWDNA